ncbi:MAG: di-trans,poly-cis-decaprenylcistransferase [Rickettsiales bacterium]|jgi:undecaprenyl diphosphate synthase|nr:di-trans,poly-cis-decaprenylcistransferase [Rickettsiales bacterium]
MKIFSKLLNKLTRRRLRGSRNREAVSVGGQKFPGHIAFLMDGNGRWAKRRGLPRTAGHLAGSDIVEKLAEYLIDNGAHTISFYAFSTENWSRPKSEVDFLMNLMAKELKRVKKHAMEKDIRVKFIGRRDNVSTALLSAMEDIEMATFANSRGNVCFAVDYGGQDEILRAAKDMLSDGVDPEKLTAEKFNSYLDSGELTPIDLLVRTSGEQRISNFMLWKSAYAEIAFIPEMWPDMNIKVMDRVLKDYNGRDRRFGGLSSSPPAEPLCAKRGVVFDNKAKK